MIVSIVYAFLFGEKDNAVSLSKWSCQELHYLVAKRYIWQSLFLFFLSIHVFLSTCHRFHSLLSPDRPISMCKDYSMVIRSVTLSVVVRGPCELAWCANLVSKDFLGCYVDICLKYFRKICILIFICSIWCSFQIYCNRSCTAWELLKCQYCVI